MVELWKRESRGASARARALTTEASSSAFCSQSSRLEGRSKRTETHLARAGCRSG